MSYESLHPSYPEEITALSHRIAAQEHLDPYHGCYRATAGTIELQDSGHAIGTMGFTAYHKPDSPGRPVTFFGGGGPIAAATLWGALELSSPLEIAHSPGGHLPAEPSLRPHPHALLHDSDVVNFDAMGVGYGRAHPDQDPSHFFGVGKDARAFAAAIRWYMKEHQREGDPIVLVGGSYGARRTITLANIMHSEANIAGLALISPGYDDTLRQFGTDDPRPHITQLPAFATATLYHSGLRDPRHIQSIQHESHAFAWGDYAAALAGGPLSNSVINKMTRYTGLPKELVMEYSLRIPPELFQKQLLGRRGLQISGVDTRLAFPADASDEFDPALDVWKDRYIRLATRHFADHFGYTPEDDSHHYVGNVNAAARWEYDGIWKERNATAALADMMAKLPDLPVVETIGHFDIRSLIERCRVFWEEMSKQEGINLQLRTANPDMPTVSPGTISRYELFSGHQPGADPASKRQTTGILRLLSRVAASSSA